MSSSQWLIASDGWLCSRMLYPRKVVFREVLCLLFVSGAVASVASKTTWAEYGGRPDSSLISECCRPLKYAF